MKASLRTNLTMLAAIGMLLALGIGASGWLGNSQAQDQEPQKDKAAASAEAPLSHAKALSAAFRKAAEGTMPTVVTIRTSTKATPIRQKGKAPPRDNPFKGTPFEDFFNEDDMERFFSNPGQRPSGGVGSGVIIDRAGIILTNNHVVEGADEVLVHLADGREYKGTDIKVDPQTDLAIVRIEGADDLPVATLGDSEAMEIGDWVIAVGNPFELESTVSAGIISGKGRELGAGQRTKYLQTDAAINPGNSGGPLVNLDGEVVGINTAIATTTGQYAGVGFAIPVNHAKWIVSQLIKKGNVDRAYLGVGIEPITPELADQFGIESKQGVLVSEVFPDTPASAAGFAEGDVITAFAGKQVRNPRELQELVERCELDSEQVVTVVRDNQPIDLNVVVKALPTSLVRASRQRPTDEGDNQPPAIENEELGLEVSDLSIEKSKEFGYDGYSGVLITSVAPDSVAYNKGLREGMLILKIGKQAVASVEEFDEALKGQTLDKGILLQVRTQGGNRFVVLKNE
jgi:serine protease Do